MTYSLAIGPFHQAWLGPQRIVMRVDGEQIVDIGYRDEYNERGCAERLTRLDLSQALHLVTRICGLCSFAHSLAFCQAIEQLCRINVPDRALFVRSAVAELERAASHLQAAARLLDALGMESRASVLRKLRETTAQLLKTCSGSRIIPDMCLPGGLRRNISARDREILLTTLPKLNRGIYRFADGLIDHRALLARTVEVGALPRTAAEQFGVRGPLARASGMPRDARADHPYAAYERLAFRMITQEGGDVYARLVMLVLESLEGVKLAEQALHLAPDGDWQGRLPDELRAGQGTGVVEGPRGMLRYTLESDGQRLKKVRIDAPRQLDRLLTRTLLANGLIDNAVAIIASCDTCTACAER